VLIAARHHLEGQIGLFAAQWQVIASLVNDEKLVSVDRAMHHFAIAALALSGLEHQHQISDIKEAGLIAFLRGQITEGDRDMGFADLNRIIRMNPFCNSQAKRLV
jgi:hypothetical protein